MGGGGETSVTDVADTVRVTTVTKVMHKRTKIVIGDAQSQRLSFSSTLLVFKVAPTFEARAVTFPYIGTRCHPLYYSLLVFAWFILSQL